MQPCCDCAGLHTKHYRYAAAIAHRESKHAQVHRCRCAVLVHSRSGQVCSFHAEDHHFCMPDQGNTR